MATCGCGFTLAVTEDGRVHAWGRNCEGQLGTDTSDPGTCAYTVLPTPIVLPDPILQVSVGPFHAAGVAVDGSLYTWGRTQGLQHQSGTPVRIGIHLFGDSRAVLVACGEFHTALLTEIGAVLTCGCGMHGKLGHGNEVSNWVLTQVPAEHFLVNEKQVRIVMIAAGGDNSIAIGEEGGFWGWGRGDCIGHGGIEDKFVPTPIELDHFGEKAIAKFISVGFEHSVAISDVDEVWAWGENSHGQLGLPMHMHELKPIKLGSIAFWGTRVLSASCGRHHTLAVTVTGTLWSWGKGGYGRLGLNDTCDRWVPRLVDKLNFGNAKIVSVAAGNCHSAVRIYTRVS